VPYFAVDDGFADHQKVVRLQAMKGWQAAIALWTLAGSWASKHLTDGAVPTVIVTRLGHTERDADLLVTAGLWERAEGGYQFHEWSQRNPTRKTVEARREKTRKRVTDWRSNQSRNGVTDEVTDSIGNAAPFPSLPIPSQDPPNPQAPDLTKTQPPQALKFHLQALVGVEYERRGETEQKASDSFWRDGAARVWQACDQGKFATAEAGCEALARAAVEASLKPGGKLCFALQEAPFAEARRPLGLVRGLDVDERV
jgi:hypothetical protein